MICCVMGVKVVINWNNLLLTMLLIGNTLCALGERDAVRFSQANDLYKQMKYTDAYKLYQDIEQPNARVYFNMGNCAFELNQYGRSLWHFRQAEELWGFADRKDLKNNIKLVMNKLEKARSFKSNANQWAFSVVYDLTKSFPLIIFQILFLLFWTCLFVYARRLIRRKQKMVFALLVMGVFISGALLLIRQERAIRSWGIVLEREVALYAGPNETYQKIGTLYEGKELLIEQERKDFVRVKSKNAQGWILRSSLGFI